MPVVISGTNGITNATWTTAGRPASPSTGQQGYNTTTAQIEVYNATYGTWNTAGTAGNCMVGGREAIGNISTTDDSCAVHVKDALM